LSFNNEYCFYKFNINENMKHTYIFAILMWFSLALYCQTTSVTTVEAMTNEIVELKLNGYIGNIQWQCSDDTLTWTDSTNCTANKLQVITKSSRYYRAKVTAGTCPSYFSEITYIKLTNKELIITTDAITSITKTTASSGGNITNDGEAPITARGVCWSTSRTPTIADSKTNEGQDTGSFASSIAGLTSNTTYYVRAYAINSVDTSYGQQLSFTTSKYSIINYDKTILTGKGYIVGNGNSLVVDPNYHYFSDFIRLAEGDTIRIYSTGNNLTNSTYGNVVCDCTYGANLDKITRLENTDTHNLSHVATAEEKYLRLSCATTGLSSFKVTIKRTNSVTLPSTIKALKRLGTVGEANQLGNIYAQKVDSNKIILSNDKLPKLTPLNRSQIDVNFSFTSADSVYKNFKVAKGILQWVDNRDRMFFTANIGWVTKKGMCDRTILFYSDDYCSTFKLLYDFKELMVQDFEIPCVMVTDAGTILFTKSQNSVTSATLRPHSVWAIEGWKNGTITNLLDGEGNAITIRRKFFLSYETWAADRADLDFAQYNQVYPKDGYALGGTYAGAGRLQPGWSYNCFGNIVFICEYGRGTSYWNYTNSLKASNKDGVYSIANLNNGLGVASKAWVSLDGGTTWKMFFDLRKLGSDNHWIHCGDAEMSHVHAVNYNPFEKKFYIVNGDKTRSSDKTGYESWMGPNPSICSISLADVQKYYNSASIVDADTYPELINTTNTPSWDVTKLPTWMKEDFGNESQLQFTSIEPFDFGNLFSTDCAKVDGFFRALSSTKLTNLDWNMDTRISYAEKVFSQVVHMGGGQQTIRAGQPRLLSVVPADLNTAISYVFSTEDGSNWNTLYTDTLGEISWGVMLFYTKNGIYIRPNNTTYKILKLSNNTDF
jgi:hypothetical protein